MAKTTAIPAMVSAKGKSELSSSFLLVSGSTTKWNKTYNIYKSMHMVRILETFWPLKF